MDGGPRIPAAQYVRMSTEHQRYSIEFQSRANETYARGRGYEIVQTYADEGVSGLGLKRRDGLKQLLADVVAGTAAYSVVLVYDVSRWGRFQDPDESAHYEFLCREAGVRVEYSAEPFENDGSLASVLVKHLKRAMAAEYVRELSSRIRRAQAVAASKGYWTGGPAPFGYRRQAIAADGAALDVMGPGERKALQGCHTILVAGPIGEVETVRRIFRMFVIHGLSIRSIAKQLNGEGVTGSNGAAWTEWKVRQVLVDEKYVGTLITGRYATYLKHRTVQPKKSWRRVRGACPVLVNRRLFESAQANIRHSDRAGTDDELIAELREAMKRHGRLSHRVLSLDTKTHDARVYLKRFGTLERAFELAGYERSARQSRAAENARRNRPQRFRTYAPQLSDEEMLRRLRDLYRREGRLTADLIHGEPGVPSDACYRKRFGSLQRAYELVGYEPSRAQVGHFKRSG
jgi:DNA invertase Pin-like site-specific DNA recombinase